MMDNDGMLSIDFLAGFSIFMIGLIIVISMVPGILVGIESYNIDYDAVAYRTGVVLVEDPGWSNNGTHWEMENFIHKNDIERLGLAVSKDTPNILSKLKVEKFFNTSYFTIAEIDQKLIFGDMPYSYNFTLDIADGSRYGFDSANDLSVNGSSPIPDISYGFIKRLVKVKEYSSAVVDCNSTEYRGEMARDYNATSITNTTSFYVKFDYSDLVNETIDPSYRIDVYYEPVSFHISNYTIPYRIIKDASDVTNDTESVVLENVRFMKGGTHPVFIPLNYSKSNDDYYQLYTHFTNGTGRYITLDETLDVTESDWMQMDIYPDYLSQFSLDTEFLVNFTFTYYFHNTSSDDPLPPLVYTNHEFVEGTFVYDYDNVTPGTLNDGVLEVAIW